MLWWQSHSSICSCKVDLCFYWIRGILYVDDEIHYVIVNFHVYPELDNFFRWRSSLSLMGWAVVSHEAPINGVVLVLWYSHLCSLEFWCVVIMGEFSMSVDSFSIPSGLSWCYHKARRDGAVMHYWYKHICVYWYFSCPRAELIFLSIQTVTVHSRPSWR